MNATPSGWIALRGGALSAAIDPEGAQLSVLRDAQGQDLLWNGDAAVWKGRAPILFPIIGALNGGHFLWHGARYALPRHGFARDRLFELVHQSEHEVLLRLAADSETRRVYPFDFRLDVAFSLQGEQLTVQASVHNTGTGVLPASLGFHPAFRWPLQGSQSRDDYFLEFAAEELAPVRRLNAAGLLTGQRYPTPVVHRRLQLADALFAEDALIFDQLASRRVVYGTDRGPRIAVDFLDASHLGLWTKPAARFICIEPWRGVADPQGFDGEFEQKPGVFLVPPGGQQQLTMRLEWLAA